VQRALMKHEIVAAGGVGVGGPPSVTLAG
jgi:hypothetical protein